MAEVRVRRIVRRGDEVVVTASVRPAQPPGAVPTELGRLTLPSVLVLAALVAGPASPRRILEEVNRHGEVPIRPGTLYGSLARLERRRLVTPQGAPVHGRTYALTDAGRRAIEAVAGVLAAIERLGGVEVRGG